jgi:stage V sporulation protein AC
MANAKKKRKLTATQQEYKVLADRIEPKRPVVVNCMRAFLFGGSICLLGEGIRQAFTLWGGFDEKKAGDPTVAVLILISVILTSFGVYDKIGQWAGAGSAVPVTGFANSLVSAAIEHRSEGLILGVGGKMFKLAGPVIVYGTFAAFVIGIIHLIFQSVGG